MLQKVRAMKVVFFCFFFFFLSFGSHTLKRNQNGEEREAGNLKLSITKCPLEGT